MNEIPFDALIVAAGRPRLRDGFSPAQKLGSLSVIRRIIQTFRQAGALHILVVTGYRAEYLEKHLARSGATCVRNVSWETTDMMASVKLGLSKFRENGGILLFTPADIPLFTVDTVKKLLRAGSQIAVPSVNGKSGHPLLLSKDLIPKLLSYDGNLGLKDALKKTGIPRERVEVKDEGILYDAEDGADFDSLLERHNRQPYHPQIQIFLEREVPFFDHDAAMLLRFIEEVHSVRRACSLMGISYSKGWNVLNEMELQSGMTIISRRAGGQTGGSTALTMEGLEFLKRFEAYEKQMRQLSLSEFYRIFPELREQKAYEPDS